MVGAKGKASQKVFVKGRFIQLNVELLLGNNNLVTVIVINAIGFDPALLASVVL